MSSPQTDVLSKMPVFPTWLSPESWLSERCPNIRIQNTLDVEHICRKSSGFVPQHWMGLHGVTLQFITETRAFLKVKGRATYNYSGQHKLRLSHRNLAELLSNWTVNLKKINAEKKGGKSKNCFLSLMFRNYSVYFVSFD